MRTTVRSDPGCPSNGSAWTKPSSGIVSCHIRSSSVPSMTGASVTWVAEATGREPDPAGAVAWDGSRGCAQAGATPAVVTMAHRIRAEFEKSDMRLTNIYYARACREGPRREPAPNKYIGPQLLTPPFA